METERVIKLRSKTICNAHCRNPVLLSLNDVSGVSTLLCSENIFKDFPDGHSEVINYKRKIKNSFSELITDAILFGGKLIMLLNDPDGTVKKCDIDTLNVEDNEITGVCKIGVDNIHKHLYCFPFDGYNRGYIIVLNEQYNIIGLIKSNIPMPKYIIPMIDGDGYFVATNNTIHFINKTGNKLRDPVRNIRYPNGEFSENFNNIRAFFRLENGLIVLISVLSNSTMFIIDPLFTTIIKKYSTDAFFGNADYVGNNCFDVYHSKVSFECDNYVIGTHFEIAEI